MHSLQSSPTSKDNLCQHHERETERERERDSPASQVSVTDVNKYSRSAIHANYFSIFIMQVDFFTHNTGFTHSISHKNGLTITALVIWHQHTHGTTLASRTQMTTFSQHWLKECRKYSRLLPARGVSKHSEHFKHSKWSWMHTCVH
jgi:hypothetical protein